MTMEMEPNGFQNSAKSQAKYLRVPPRKARLAAGLIRRKSVESAIAELNVCGMKSGDLLIKVIRAAVANAETVFNARRDLLHIVEVRVDEGPRLKRSKSKSRGGRAPFQKKMSHFTVVVGEKIG